MTKTIGIVGCGWLGKSLSVALSDEYSVECFSRDKTTENSSFWQSDTIIIAINTKDNYLNTLEKIAKLTSNSSNIILCSSISVYREFETVVDEDVIITKDGVQKQAEDLMLTLRDAVVILRLGGLMGEDRISGRWKSISKFSDTKVNYIHRDDVVAITKQILKKTLKSKIYNLVAPLHPLRSEVHKKNSEKFGFVLGEFEAKISKVVKSEKIVKELGYDFIYPNPLTFWD